LNFRSLNIQEYFGGASQYACTLDTTFGMKYGLLNIGEYMPRNAMDAGMQSFVDYIEGPARECMSHFDGGQLMFNFLLREQKTLMWSGHLGGYDGILKAIEPKPNVLIQAIAGRANLNGRPFDGSAAQFATSISHWLGEPKMVVWCLHYDSPIKSLDASAFALLPLHPRCLQRPTAPPVLWHVRNVDKSSVAASI
jgi:hypothetical protein